MISKLTPQVSIIFPVHIISKTLYKSLLAIKSITNSSVEVLVVDNTVKTHLRRTLKSYPWVRLLSNHPSASFAASINMGIKKSRGNYIFVTNDDAIVHKNALYELLSASSRYDDLCILGGQIYSLKYRKKFLSAGYMLNRWTGNVYPNQKVRTPRTKVRGFFLYKSKTPYRKPQEAIHPLLNKAGLSGTGVINPDWIQGCALFIPVRVIRMTGLFDTGFNHFFEDTDLCFRAKKIGIHIVTVPSAIFFHDESTTANKNKTRKYLLWYKNKFRFIFKHLPLINVLTIVGLHVLFVIPYRNLVLHDGRFIPFIRGIVWNIIHLRDTLTARRTSLVK